MNSPSLLDPAFKELYLKYFPRVYATAYSLLRQHEKSEDVAQNVFLKLLEHWDTILPDNIEGYLVTMARNAVLNEFRRNSVTSKYHTFIKERFQEETDNLEEQIIARQEFNLLEKAVQDLPVRQQQAWRLSRQQGLSYKEIGEVMDISKTSVKDLLKRSVQALKSSLSALRSYLVL
ncbi:RNA polymerase sigma factor [[Flexibacter] sp. ATCC 35208]|uniref:RNA polymerase sigma factor n=1 Tax=[Flexibacter] sp. ATCC 35208 TaxID=1936242 RepID=UPI0015C331B6|nr:sigma-70 family RNA polymerase sigma factor [[Flexibacter] sp. ATCC 35208]